MSNKRDLPNRVLIIYSYPIAKTPEYHFSPSSARDYRCDEILKNMDLTGLSDLSAAQIILALSGFWAAFQLLKALYNISPLHPLHKIPGPKLAAATYLPEFYHDVVLGGRFTHAIQRMHEQYGECFSASGTAWEDR